MHGAGRGAADARTFGSLLRQHRLAAGLTQEQLAERTGLGVRSIQDLEREVSRPLRRTAAAIVDALGVQGEALEEFRLAAAPAPRWRATGSRTSSPADMARHNLPVDLSSFIGREVALAQARRLLVNARLLTLVGPGGIGKTRLALRVGAAEVPHYADGVWAADLTPLTSPQLVATAVSSAMRLPEVPGRSALETVIAELTARKLLLILDNCEHLVDACADLVSALLRACPELRVLATSREPLGVAGEVRWHVPPLQVPAGAAAEGEAVELFVERARAVQPDFSLNEANAATVAQICRQLEGVPLALELAAAQSGVLSLKELADRLHDSLGLLAQGTRSAPPRQRTLRASLDWSHNLLDEPERALFRRLSVFAGGCTLDAVEAVSGADLPVLDAMAGLVSKSLVAARDGPFGMRYQLNGTVRQYADERLNEAAETRHIRTRQLDWCIALAEQAEAELHGPRQISFLDHLEAERDNLRAALRWAAAEAPDNGLRLASALVPFWNLRGSLREGRAWFDELLECAIGVSPELRARAMRHAPLLWFWQSDSMRASELAAEGVSLSRALGDLEGEAFGLSYLGYARLAAGDAPASACSMLEQAVGTARRSESRVAIYTALFSLARAAAANGDYDTARLLDCEALDLQRSQGDHAFMGITLSRYAQTLIRLGLLAEARAALEESFGLQRMVGPNQSFVSLLDPLVELTLAEQDFVRAVQLDGAAEALHAAIGVPRAPARLRGVLENGRAQARNALGAATAEEVWSRGTRLSLEQAVRLGLQPVAIERAISNTRPIAAPADQLSKRELEIVRLVAVGSSNAEIASQLVLSVRTVERHLANIYAKLGAQGRSARALAVTRAIGSGLVTVR